MVTLDFLLYWKTPVAPSVWAFSETDSEGCGPVSVDPLIEF